MNKVLNNNQGLTLIEVLVSITILGIVLTTFLSFFTQAYSYTKKNQNKTVGINVARNVLYYMEQRDYQSIKEQYFPIDNNSSNEVQLTIDHCNDPVFDSAAVCKGFFLSKINNVDYSAIVKLSSDVKNNNSEANPDLTKYLIGVEVEVTWENHTATVRGLIKK